MKICRLSTICDSALRLLFTGLVSMAFVLSAVHSEIKEPQHELTHSEKKPQSNLNNSNLIAGAEEEVELDETSSDPGRKQTVKGDYLIPAVMGCGRTEGPYSVSNFQSCIGVRHLQKAALYILYQQLKINPNSI